MTTAKNAVVSKILLATDFSDSANLAQMYAEYLAVALKASLVVLHVTEHPSPTKGSLTEREIRTRLQTLQDKIEERAVPVSVQRSRGDAGDQIVSAARRLDADVIAMGMQGQTHVPYGLVGSTAYAVATSGPCPVLTVPLPSKEASPCLFTTPGAAEIRRILAPVDFSGPSLDSLECAIQLAHRLQAELVLLHVLESADAGWDFHRMQGAAQMHDQWEARLGNLAGGVKDLGLSATYDVRPGFPPDSILAGALRHRCDLIVMGTHGRRGRERTVVGSVAEAVLKQATCPVLTVKNPKFARDVRPAIRAALSKDSENAMDNGGVKTDTRP
jgi:nucleotide-binding universal stress UspA family protein